MHPVTRALRLQEMAEEHAGNGRLAEAESCCGRALALLKDVCGPRHPDVAGVLCTLSEVLGRAHRWRQAEDTARKAVEVVEAAAVAMDRREADILLLRALGLVGTALRQQRRHREAETVLRRATGVAGEHPGDAMLLAEACYDLGVLFQHSGNFLGAEMQLRRALLLTECTVGRHCATAANIYRSLGSLECARGRFERGLMPATRAWQIRRGLLGTEHPDTIADAVALAAILDGLGRYAESRAIYQRALETCARLYGPEHYEVAVHMNHLAAVEHAEGRLDAAEALYRRALAIKQRLLGAEHPESATTAHDLGLLMQDRRRAAAARQSIERALETLQPSHC